MERGLTMTRPMSFSFNDALLKQYQTSLSIIPASTSARSTLRRRETLYLKASNGSSFKRQTLSSDWDIYSSKAPVLPKFEELDTTNMLLRQRIIFLGSQVTLPLLLNPWLISFSLQISCIFCLLSVTLFYLKDNKHR